MTARARRLWIASVAAVCLLIGFGAPILRVQSTEGSIQLAPRSSTQPQPTDLHALHRAGQTFLTWKEPEPLPLGETSSVPEIIALRAKLEETRRIRYRIYRSEKPIETVDGLTPIGEVPALSCWNTDFYGLYPQPQHKAFRYSIVDGQGPLPAGTGLYVHNPSRGGTAFYAVTMSVNGRENHRLTEGNSLSLAVRESVGRGEPVFQREETRDFFIYVNAPTIRTYVRWESPPNFSVENKPFDYLVAIPRSLARPAPVMLAFHPWGGNIEGWFGWWFNAERGAMLVSSNATPYDWWTGYHERLYSPTPPKTPEEWRQGVVRPYAQTRMLSFLDWLATRYDIDLTRTFTAGASMGGSGAIMMALRHPERIAWSLGWVGIHRPRLSPTFKESYDLVYGRPEWDVRFEDGTPVWDYFDNVQYLKRDPGRDVPLMILANGKNDASIGWQQAVDFVRALQETRQPHVFYWGQNGHGERAPLLGGDQRNMSMDLRTTLSLPAFTGGTLDDDPGNGSPNDGDPTGQINAHLYWDERAVVDQPDRWEVTVGIFESAPQPKATVNVTPRRMRQFKVPRGGRVTWTNKSLRGPRVDQAGEAVADQFGLITLKDVVVTTGRTRIRISTGISSDKR